MNNGDTAQLYQWYCRFLEDLNQAVHSSGVAFRM